MANVFHLLWLLVVQTRPLSDWVWVLNIQSLAAISKQQQTYTVHIVLDEQCIIPRGCFLNLVLLNVVFVCLFVGWFVITPAREYLLTWIRHRKAKVGPMLYTDDLWTTSISCRTCCNTGPRFLRSLPKEFSNFFRQTKGIDDLSPDRHATSLYIKDRLT